MRIILVLLFKHRLIKNHWAVTYQFNTITTVRVTGRLEEFDGDDLDGAMKAELALEALREEIERAVINSYELTRQIQQFIEIRSQIGYQCRW